MIEQDKRGIKVVTVAFAGILFACVTGFVAGWYAASHPEPETHSLLNLPQRNCVGDWVSGSVTCRFIDAQGNVVVSRSY